MSATNQPAFLTVTEGPAIRPRALAAPAATQAVGTLPLAVDLVLYRGDDFYLDVAVTDDAGQPFTLAGYTPAAQVRQTTDAAEIVATFVATVSTNVVHLHLTAAVAVGLTDGVWDVQVTSAAGEVTTLAFGAVRVTHDVTRTP